MRQPGALAWEPGRDTTGERSGKMASTPGLQMAGYTAMPSYSPVSDEGLVSTTELVSVGVVVAA